MARAGQEIMAVKGRGRIVPAAVADVVVDLLAAVRFDTFFGDGWAKGGLAICH
jgi:hypothetical protein